ncbi:hypothetical protein Tco_1400056 [Tanacetum coccineum]
MIPGTDLHCFDVHNDGYFSHLPLTYVDGAILEMVVRMMPYEEFVVYLEEKCGCYFQGLYYQVPNHDLERGLVKVSDDRSLSYMFDVEETFGRLNLYLDHLDMDLSEYLSQAITNEIDACVFKKIIPPKKSTRNIDKGIDATDCVEARTSTTDKGKEKVSKDATEVVETRRNIIEIDSETKYDSDDDSDYQSDKSVDYLSPEMNEPNDENSMPVDNVRGEDFEEHDIYMNELLKSLNTADKDGITEDLFISIEKHVEMYPMYDETTQWRLRKPKVGEKSGEVRVVAKFGQRPPRLSDPEKCKQRKQTKYPCASSDDLPTCPWRCYARWMTTEKTFQCISLEDEHTCVRNFNFGSLVNYKWIPKVFGDKIRANPDIRLCDIADLVMKKYKSYGKPILDSNPGSTVKLGVTVNPDGKTFFDRFYVCFASGSRGRGAGGSKRKHVSITGTQKRQGKKKVGTYGFAKWFGLQVEPEQIQDKP